jgi:hypothetical protein
MILQKFEMKIPKNVMLKQQLASLQQL